MIIGLNYIWRVIEKQELLMKNKNFQEKCGDLIVPTFHQHIWSQFMCDDNKTIWPKKIKLRSHVVLHFLWAPKGVEFKLDEYEVWIEMQL